MRTEKEIQMFIWSFYEENIPPESYKAKLIESIINLEIAQGFNADLEDIKRRIVKKDRRIKTVLVDPILEDREFDWDK